MHPINSMGCINKSLLFYLHFFQKKCIFLKKNIEVWRSMYSHKNSQTEFLFTGPNQSHHTYSYVHSINLYTIKFIFTHYYLIHTSYTFGMPRILHAQYWRNTHDPLHSYSTNKLITIPYF